MTWHARAACKGCDPEIFFPDKNKGMGSKQRRVIQELCAGCSVRSECLEEALREDRKGFWGGLSERERKAVKRNRRQPDALSVRPAGQTKVPSC